MHASGGLPCPAAPAPVRRSAAILTVIYIDTIRVVIVTCSHGNRPRAPRILRADLEEFEPEPPPVSKRRQAQRDRIFALVPRLLARRGLAGITLPNLALALDISTSVLRRHVIDIHFLLYKLLLSHLRAITAALDSIPQAEDRAEKCRAAYLAAPRTEGGKFLPVHTLLIRDRALLPPDLLDIIEDLLGDIAGACGGCETLALLDKANHAETTAESRLDRLRRAREILKNTPPPPVAPDAPKRPNFFTAAWAAEVLARANHPPPGTKQAA